MTYYDAGTTDDNGMVRNFHYQLAEFSNGDRLYQECDSNGVVIRFLDIDGNPTLMPTTEYGIIDSTPPRPVWGT